MTEPAKTETKNRQMTFVVLEDGSIKAEFGPGVDPIQFHPASLPEAIWPNLMASGAMARLRSYTSRLAGEDRTPGNLAKAIGQGVTDLQKGVWSREATGGSGIGEISMEAEAAYVFRVKRGESTGTPYTGTKEQAAADFAALSDDQKAKLKALKRYELAYAEVKAARQAAKAAKLAKKVSEEEDESGF